MGANLREEIRQAEAKVATNFLFYFFLYHLVQKKYREITLRKNSKKKSVENFKSCLK